MIQKITLEIQNDTGVEFEETTKWDCPKESEYFINSRHRIEKSDRFSSCYHVVLTPKIDHELESARKKFPVGSYYTSSKRMKGVILTVDMVKRDTETNTVLLVTNDLADDVKHCTPFPLPVWRCCEADRPKKEGYYFLRNKTTKEGDYVFFDRHYRKNMIWHNYEWLDEGEK